MKVGTTEQTRKPLEVKDKYITNFFFYLDYFFLTVNITVNQGHGIAKQILYYESTY